MTLALLALGEAIAPSKHIVFSTISQIFEPGQELGGVGLRAEPVRRMVAARGEGSEDHAAGDAGVMATAAITGLAAEARIARRIGWHAISAGGNAERTRRGMTQLLAEGADALVSFGICGGLDPALASGALILAEAVTGEDGRRHRADAALRGTLAAGLGRAGIAALAGDILGAERAADTPARKGALYRRSGALAIDLESHLVAEAAAGAGLPFAVLRVIADPAERALPPAALIGLDAAGRPAFGRILLSLARRPGQLPALLQLARDTRRGLAALLRAAEALRAAPA